MGILEDLRDGKPCRWTGVCGEMSAVGGCTCGEAAGVIEKLRDCLKMISWSNKKHLTEEGNYTVEGHKECVRMAKDALKEGE